MHCFFISTLTYFKAVGKNKSDYFSFICKFQYRYCKYQIMRSLTLNKLEISKPLTWIMVLLLFFCINPSSLAQEEKEAAPPFKERLFFGGNLGLQFGSITDIQISPVVGYWLFPRLAVAVGPDYRFYKDLYDRTNIYGAKGYLQFTLIQDLNSFIPLGVHTGIFAHIEDEWLNLDASFWKNNNEPGRFNINTILAGGGLSQQVGRRSSIDIMVLWALNQSVYQVYSNPEIRVSFIF